MSKCLIITGGDFSPIPDNIEYDFVIACDAGYNNSIKLGIKPDLIIGDFDSYKGNPSEDFGNIPTLTFPVQKDDTDTMLAIKHALNDGYNHIIICCAFGGRMDHTIANIQSMAYAAYANAKCEILTQNEHLYTLLPGTMSLSHKEDYSLSIFSLTDESHGVTVSGVQYSCEDITLTNHFPLGMSNKIISDKAYVSLKNGILLIVESRY